MQSDYVIVGAGSAGCAVAYRLAEAGHSVTIIEYGGSDRSPLINMPGALSLPMNMRRYDWGYRSEPEPHLGGRRLVVPRGKVIGGSSSINGMVYVRGHAKDFDYWAASGADGWSFSDVHPYFMRLENWHDGGHGGDESWRGQSGPVHVSRGVRKNPLIRAFTEAGQQAGYPITQDYNGRQQEGFGPFEMTVWKGQRWSAAKAYLRPALATKLVNLVRGRASCVRLDGKRAVGVEIERPQNSQFIAANREVILAASAINSPQLLMLSGIGPSQHLAEYGIPVVADRAGVGQNLQDHLEVYIQQAATKPVSLYKYWNLFGKAYVGALWLLARRGPGASNQFESCGFIRSRPGIDYPDIQFHFLPIAVRYDGQVPPDGHGFQAHVGPMRSESRGEVLLASANPSQAPRIIFNYMSCESDWIDFRRCIRLTREILAQRAFDPYRGHEIQPGDEARSDEELDAFVRDHVESAYHPCGTCRMGQIDDPMAVVDSKTRVIGVDRLRVVVSSIFPRITNGNINAPTMMVGERAADLILNRDPLPPSNAFPWQHPHWQERQR